VSARRLTPKPGRHERSAVTSPIARRSPRRSRRCARKPAGSTCW
jgi:hypothetical protein